MTLSRRRINRRPFQVNLPVDREDLEREYPELVTRLSRPGSLDEVLENLQRTLDDCILKAIFEDSGLLRPAARPLMQLAAIPEVRVNATEGLTLEKLQEIQQNFIENEIGQQPHGHMRSGRFPMPEYAKRIISAPTRFTMNAQQRAIWEVLDPPGFIQFTGRRNYAEAAANALERRMDEVVSEAIIESTARGINHYESSGIDIGGALIRQFSDNMHNMAMQRSARLRQAFQDTRVEEETPPPVPSRPRFNPLPNGWLVEQPSTPERSSYDIQLTTNIGAVRTEGRRVQMIHMSEAAHMDDVSVMREFIDPLNGYSRVDRNLVTDPDEVACYAEDFDY